MRVVSFKVDYPLYQDFYDECVVLQHRALSECIREAMQQWLNEEKSKRQQNEYKIKVEKGPKLNC